MNGLSKIDREEPQTPEQEENVMLKENNRRFVLFPIQHAHVWHAYKKTEAKFWSAEEIELADDLDDFNALPRRERVSILHLVASVAAIPAANVLLSRLSNDVQAGEVRAYFGFQIMQAAVHCELANVILDMYLNNATETILSPEDLAAALSESQSSAMTQAWIASKITESPAKFEDRLVALAIFYRLASTVQAYVSNACKGMLPGLVHAFAKIYRDWCEYSRFGVHLLTQHFSAIDPVMVKRLVDEFAGVQCAWVDELVGISGGYLGPSGSHVDPEAVKEFVRYAGNAFMNDVCGQNVFEIEGEGSERAGSVQNSLVVEAGRDEAEGEDEKMLVMAKMPGVGGDDGKERAFELSFDF